MPRADTQDPPRPERKCDCCGRPCTSYREVCVKAAGKANVYIAGTAKWCHTCRRDNRGTWKYR